MLEAEHVGFGASGRNGGWVSALWPVSPDATRRPPRPHGGPGPAGGPAGHRRRGGPGRGGAGPGRRASSRAARSWWPARRRRRPAPVRPPRARPPGTTARSGWMPSPPASGSTSAERVEPPSPPTVPGCTRAGSSTGSPPRCAGSVGGSSRALASCAPLTGSSCSVTASGSARRPSWSPPRGGPGACRGCAGASPRCTPSWSPPSRSTTPAGPGSGSPAREVFADHGHVVIYGQRTDDGRIAFGGRGAPYHWGSRDPPRVRRGAVGLRRAAHDAARPAPPARRHPVHARLGWPARHRARLAPVGDVGPADPHRAGGRLRRRRGRREQPRRAHAGRPRARAGHRAHRAAVGRAPLAPLGARAAALARGQRRPARWPGSPTARRPLTGRPARLGAVLDRLTAH